MCSSFLPFFFFLDLGFLLFPRCPSLRGVRVRLSFRCDELESGAVLARCDCVRCYIVILIWRACGVVLIASRRIQEVRCIKMLHFFGDSLDRAVEC